jgi:hypothetical protein
LLAKKAESLRWVKRFPKYNFGMFNFDQIEEKRRVRIRQMIDLCHKYVAPYTVISIKPLIFFIQIDLDTARTVRDYKFLFDLVNNQTAYIICSTAWYFEHTESIAAFDNLLKRFKREYPNFRFIVLCNTPGQLDLFSEKAIEAVFCNNNCFIDEKIFSPLSETEKNTMRFTTPVWLSGNGIIWLRPSNG